MVFSLSICMEKSINAVIGGVGMFLSPRTLKSLNSIEKNTTENDVRFIQRQPRTKIISWCSPTNASDETDTITVYNQLSPLVWHIPKHNVLIIGGDVNAQTGKDENN